MAASNTMECLRDLRGRKIVGAVQAKFDHSEYGPTKILVLDDGTGFAFNSIGSFWRVSQRELERELFYLKRDYEHNHALLSDVLDVAGAET
jgi:hypothetical protein